jgi:hypothetical protein
LAGAGLAGTPQICKLGVQQLLLSVELQKLLLDLQLLAIKLSLLRCNSILDFFEIRWRFGCPAITKLTAEKADTRKIVGNIAGNFENPADFTTI